MKDSLLNLLVFLLAFLASALFLLSTYAVAMVLVPGGQGLVFSNPFAAALLPSLLVGLVIAQFRTVRHPGSFTLSWLFQGAAFFLLLSLPVPAIESMPALRASDASPLVPHRFLPLEGGSQLLSSGQAVARIPADGGPMEVVDRVQFDGLHQRFLFSTGEPLALGSTGPEREYYQFPTLVQSVETDLLTVYTTLRASWTGRPLLFWFQTLALTLVFLGLYTVYSIRTWPMVHLILTVLGARLALAWAAWSLWTVPGLVGQWVPPGSFLTWTLPVVLLGLTGATLFFLTWLTKPHRAQGGL